MKPKYTFAQLFRISYIETALWPIWYFKDCLCESSIHQTAKSKLSRKKHFRHKWLGQVLDYSQNFALLQFQYKRWCYQIISGTIESGKKFGASSATSMGSKPICHTFWCWQHVILLDTVDQLGYSSLFVTITANEWEMIKPFWVTARSSVTGCAPTHYAFSETMQIVHALQQIICGFMAGTTHKNWRQQHLFANLRHYNRKNVKAFFYRIEFQKRGTPHVHALFWISDIRKLEITCLHSSLPNNNLNLAFQVSHLQQQRKPGRTNLTPNHCPTAIHPTNNTIEFHRTEEDCNLGLMAYLDELNLAFRSHHDIQSSDGHDLLLQYVSSYVIKTHDDAIGQSLYDADLDARNAAFRFIVQHHPCEPEMWFYMSNFKSCYHSCLTKKFFVPRYNNEENHKHIIQYVERPPQATTMTLLQFQCHYVTSTSTPHPYPNSNTAMVGCKTVSLYKTKFFFQHALLNTPFSSFNELLPPCFEDIPPVLQHFAIAVHCQSNLWSDDNHIACFLQHCGLKQHNIITFLSHVCCLSTTLSLWHNGSLHSNQLALSGKK